jgi:hypothetical protein
VTDPRRPPTSAARKLVAVVVPLSNRATLTPDEEISLRHLTHFLGRYDKYFVAPRSMEFGRTGFGVVRFDDRFFGSVDANRALMFSREFYGAFREYEYILLYHLDALVFSDQLEQWCEAGFDYIGAPWFNEWESPDGGFYRVGNGGFSLRRVSSFLAVMNSRQYRVDPEHYWSKHFAGRPRHVQLLNLPRRYLKRVRMFNNVRREMDSVKYNEDRFWSRRAEHYYPDFRIAPVEVGLRFAFECAPRFCFEQNGRTLPFGCHAWPRYDRAFWEPYLLT